MKDDSIVIPFFSLGLNVLPGEPCPLHIFEPRYKRMIHHCLKDDDSKSVPFGISLTHRSIVEPVGCLVDVAHIIKVFDDGRMLVLTNGVQRYRLLERIEGKDFPKARVILLDDVTQGVSPELQDEVLDRYARVAHIEGLAEQDIPNDSELLSYHIASQIQLEQAERQLLLNQVSERLRLEALLEVLEFRLKVLRHAVVVNQGPLQ